MQKLNLPDPSTGVIVLHPTLTTIARGLNEDQFLQTNEGRFCETFVHNPPHASYKLHGTYEVDDCLLGVVLWFSACLITAVTLSLCSTSEGWADWSESEQLRIRDKLEQLLLRNYGTTRSFAWGTLQAEYDPRSGSSGITIRYS